ncbi:MAG: hypothetical protein HC840_06350 [Leptolyngbyaceae cyanobacterium RM2_2_4]|nr:hypothetical protein [Leptolyngbyaceae cyanobacterium SL_5_9]NJO49143.1 hypothetical protein [Leptolyngbyaceae cyanobacterium RM2_2_4]
MGTLSARGLNAAHLFSQSLFVNCLMPATPEAIAKFVQFCQNRRGAALGWDLSDTTEDKLPNATPSPQNNSEPGVAFGKEIAENRKDRLPNAAPLRVCYLDNQPVAYINSSLKAIAERKAISLLKFHCTRYTSKI